MILVFREDVESLPNGYCHSIHRRDFTGRHTRKRLACVVPAPPTALGAPSTIPAQHAKYDVALMHEEGGVILPSNEDSQVASAGRVAQGEDDERERSWNR